MDDRLGPFVEAHRERFGVKADVVVDVGTRDGDDAAWLANQLDADLVVAVDANPLAVKRTRAKYPGFVVVECAVSDVEGVSRFEQIVSSRADFEGSSSLVNAPRFDGAVTNELTVEVRRLDSVFDGLSLAGRVLSLVKVDVEGFTWEAVRGMGDYVSRVNVFHLETEQFHRHDGHRNTREVEALMDSLNFQLVWKGYEWGQHIEDQVWVKK